MSAISSNINSHFAFISDTYDMEGTWVTDKDILELIVSLCPNLTGKKVIDIGAGTGKVISKICTAFPLLTEAYALDFSGEMLSKISNPKIKTSISDVCEMPFENQSFDTVLSRQCLHYVTDLNKALSEIHRVMNINGCFIFAQIVPYDNETSDYWRVVSKVRQPLRVHSLTTAQWIQVITQNGFCLDKQITAFTHNTLNDWIIGKKIHDKTHIDEYRRLFLDASKEYKEKYNVLEKDGDILFSSKWSICRFDKV
jgi:ubiquinone/menaquinone biosynthesis C-methylase UbiE